MKTAPFGVGVMVLLVSSLTFAQKQTVAPEHELFLSAEDIPRIHRLAPALVEATGKGSQETHAFMAAQELNSHQMMQVLTNISVAYTAVKFDEYVKQLQPLLDEKQKDSQYQQLLAQGRKQVEDLTAPYQKAKKNGRSALDVNKEAVAKNMAQVDELMSLIRNVKVESLPK
jgi:hypothetical protein